MHSEIPQSKIDASWFVHSRFGMFIHWGLYAAAARDEWVKNNERISNADYQKYFNHFNPDLYDPRDWAKAAKNAGMKYFVITVKHHEGFCLWDSQHTDYKITNTTYGKDVLHAMVDAFRNEGIRVGFYYSLLDWHHPDFTIDERHPMRDNAEERAKNSSRDMKKYAEYMRNQVRELLTQFGTIDILWFDFSYPGKDGKGRDDWESEKLIALIRSLQPQVLMDNRLDVPGEGDFITPEQYQPDNQIVDENGNPAVWEGCQTFSGSWGYHRDELTWKSVNQLLCMLIDGVSKGGNLLLNVGPTARGEIDYRACERLSGIGAWMKYHSRAIYGCGTAPQEFKTPADCRLTYNAKTNRLYIHIMTWPFKSIYCQGLVDKIEYAQFLHDSSEVQFGLIREASWNNLDKHSLEKPYAFHLPTVKPNVEIPVIEIFLK